MADRTVSYKRVLTELCLLRNEMKYNNYQYMALTKSIERVEQMLADDVRKEQDEQNKG